MKYVITHETNTGYRSSGHSTFALAKLNFNNMLSNASPGDFISMYRNKTLIYRVWNEGYHKGKIVVDLTENTLS